MALTKEFWLAAAESYVEDCARTASSVRASEFASRMQRTPVQLARAFHEAVGSTVKDYLVVRQIERAKELLCTTRRSTAHIAAAAGFGTPRSFYRAFKSSVGVPPTEFRKEMSLADD
jgi:two-component system response regulator YesN